MSHFEEIIDQAQQCLSEFRAEFPSLRTIPVPIEEIVDLKYHLRIVPAALAPEVSGTYAGGLRLVEVNQEDPIESQRFTLAHELGHHLLHQAVLREVWQEQQLEQSDHLMQGLNLEVVRGLDNESDLIQVPRRVPKDTELARIKWEGEANLFAAELLVPLDILSQFHQRGEGLNELPFRFKVSRAVMQYRLTIFYLVEDPSKPPEFRRRNLESLFYQQYLLPREDPETK